MKFGKRSMVTYVLVEYGQARCESMMPEEEERFIETITHWINHNQNN
jgi:hypothetical protein